MSKINKIIDYHLEDEVRKLRAKGYTYKTIASKINEKLENKGQKVSFMSIKRYLDNQAIQEVADEIQEGNEPGREIYKEFKIRMDKLMKDMEERAKDIDLLIEEAKQTKNIHLIAKLISLDKDYFEQARRNIISLVQYSEDRFRPIINYSEKKEVVIRNQLLDFTDLLCPVCKQKVLSKILGGS